MLQRLIISFLLFFVSASSFADACTPTSFTASARSTNGSGASPGAACGAAIAAYNLVNSWMGTVTGGATGGSFPSYCESTFTPVGGEPQAMESVFISGAYSCTGGAPSNGIQECKDAQSLYNSTLGERYTDVEMPGAVSSGTSLCVPSSYTTPSGSPVSCTMNFERDISYQDAKGEWISRGKLDMGGMSGNYVSLPCGVSTPDIPKVKPEELNPPCPPGEQQGSINGSTVCKPFGPDVVTKTDDSKSESTDSAGNKTTTETSTDCQGDKCTTTTTSKNSSGAVTGSSSNTTSKGEFCDKNSSSAQCGGAASSGGGGESGGCESGADTIGCAKFGTPGEQGETSNTDVALTFSRESGFGASDGTCPAPRVLNIPGGRTISMSFDLYCDFARGMRPFIIGFALLSAAGMVVFSATRKG